MAEIIASVLLKPVFEKLASEAFKAYAQSQGIHSELKKLEKTLTQIQFLLNDASQKEITDEAVKQWLNGLQHLAYDVDDLLDDLATDAMHCEFTQQSGAITSKVRWLVPTFIKDLSLSQRMHHKLDDITTKFEDLLNDNKRLGLIKKGEKPKGSYQTSLADTPSIVGRQTEKKELLIKLFEDGSSSDQNFSVVPIVGMGGLGKTTLARLLYDDDEVKKHFELKVWVSVSSDQFDFFNISKVILQSTKGENKDLTDLNLLQIALRNQLKEKRFLIVLDDVWNESYEDWETLVSPFRACAPGSKIIMTTRKVQLLNKLGYDDLNHLHTLSYDDAVSLFAQHALGTYNFDSHPIVRPYGEAIVKKCDGLPLALRVLGRLLRTKTEEEEWKKLLNSDIWMLGNKDKIVPALKLSYHDLSACLKQLFAYFSLYPKGYRFGKTQLISLWMAEGFLHESSSKKSMERLGDEYFEELLSRSMLQHAPNDKHLFVVHDLLNDLATFVAGELFIRLDDETVKDVRKEALDKCRHMSFVHEEYVAYPKFMPFERAKSLRTFLSFEPNGSQAEFYLSNKILADLLPRFPMLRVLRLNNYCISKLPETIGSLKHLRYLNLSRNLITHLPESVCNLYNLQTLFLGDCSKLSKLPNNFSKLKNLRHLDLSNTPLLNELPLGIGQLKSLQSLSKIILGGDNGFSITMLKDLTDFFGGIHIKGLEKVEMVMHAQEANLLQKRFRWLELEWSEVFDGSRNESLEKEVLSVLKPHSESLELLMITSYGGMEFPDWVGDPSFLQLIDVSISGCKNCTSLPPLGQLPSLKELLIEDMDEVKVIGSELNGTGVAFPSLEYLELRNMKKLEVWSTSIGNESFLHLSTVSISGCKNWTSLPPLGQLPSLKWLYIKDMDEVKVMGSELNGTGLAFPSLEHLELQNMKKLEVWSTSIGNVSFPCLQTLLIKNCPNLVQVSLEALPSLVFLTIIKCRSSVLRSLVQVASGVTKLQMESISGLNDVVWRGLIGYLGAVNSLSMRNCHKLTCLWESTASKDHINHERQTLVRLGEKVEDEDCRHPGNIESLSIFKCNSMTSISFTTTGWQKLKFLEVKCCDKLLEKEQIFSGDNTRMPMFQSVGWPNLTSLRDLTILGCPSTDASFPSGSWPPNLHTLFIGGLKKPILEWGPQNFPTSLVILGLACGASDEDDVSRCSQLSHLVPSSVTSLGLWNFNKLKSLSVGLEHLTSLQHLRLWYCPKTTHLPETLLPSLLSLTIEACPNLEKSCSRKGSYWSHISHIPCIITNPKAGSFDLRN